MRGIFQRPPKSGVWWISYFDHAGKRRREKAGSRGDAITLYQKRKVEVLQGAKIPERIRAVVRVVDLFPNFLRDYVQKGNKSFKLTEGRLRKNLLPFFGSMSVNDVGTDAINEYVDRRTRAGAASGTVNRELAGLKRMYNLALACDPPKADRVPKFPRLKESDPRQGFVEDKQYAVLVKHTQGELWLRTILALGYTYGFRKGELLLQLRVEQVDLADRTIRLYAGTTKNNAGRIVTMTNEVYELVRHCAEGKGPRDFVLTRTGGERVKDFRGAWYALCEKAGLGQFEQDADGKTQWQGLLFHDLRRSAVRNMVRRGVSEKVAMTISGHKTRAVFDRYNIVSTADLADATRKIELGRVREAKKNAVASGTRSGTNVKLAVGGTGKKSKQSKYLQ